MAASSFHTFVPGTGRFGRSSRVYSVSWVPHVYTDKMRPIIAGKLRTASGRLSSHAYVNKHLGLVGPRGSTVGARISKTWAPPLNTSYSQGVGAKLPPNCVFDVQIRRPFKSETEQEPLKRNARHCAERQKRKVQSSSSSSSSSSLLRNATFPLVEPIAWLLTRELPRDGCTRQKYSVYERREHEE
ncbi:hypothetical protein F2P81_004303 [Scophthalmus maximus]|uniref:Uncharacterized protein n=1 Tax=Scophthalmus maximus TaxID=52904 RepID=A0A6A4T5V0_SCOMX|nr:hypothetical protein F2P81_004303 [Scophthalmus maximus]